MKLILLSVLLLLQSCFQMKPSGLAESEMKLAGEWLYAYSLSEFKLNGELVVRPPGISQLLFRLTLPAEGGLSLKTHCVYYQVPYKKIQGTLTVEELKTDSSCPETPTGENWLVLTGLMNFKATLDQSRLHLDFETEGKKVTWNFLLPNLQGGLVHEKYNPMKEKKWKSGLSFLRVNSDTFLNQNNKYLGKLSDRMSRGTAIRCQQVDKNCNVVGEDRCNDCRYGWYQVVDYNCPQGGSKFCGQNHCGEKGEPACPRGSKVVFEGEEGICQSDLTPVLNADKILICQ